MPQEPPSIHRSWVLCLRSAVLAGTALVSVAMSAGQGIPISTVPVREANRMAVTGEKFQFFGTLTAEIAPGYVFLQDASGGARVRLMQPLPVKPGDELRVIVGEYDAQGGWLVAHFVERTGERPIPVPELVRADETTMIDHNSAYLTVRGEVTAHSQVEARFVINGQSTVVPFDVLTTLCDGVPVRIQFRPTDHAPELFPVGTRAEFSGVCRLSFDPSLTEARNMELMVANPSMVRVLQRAPSPPPPADLRWIYWTLSGAGVLSVIAAGWIYTRAQRARAAKRQLLQVNAELESRVAARTAELSATNESLRRSEDQLARALERQTELVQLKTNFVSLVSHEFRTPLEVITSSAFNLERYHDRLSPERRSQLLGTIKRAVQRMAGMMEQVLFLGRLEPGRVEFDPQPLHWPAFAQRCRDEILAATNHRCAIELTCEGDFSDGKGDEAVLHHVFTNLLSNAVKYSPPQSAVQFTCTREGREVCCVIRDQGCGIPEADQSSVFEAFHRAGNVENIPGTGLGLVIVRRCLDIHGGRIRFVSREGQGTTFTVHVPLF